MMEMSCQDCQYFGGVRPVLCENCATPRLDPCMHYFASPCVRDSSCTADGDQFRMLKMYTSMVLHIPREQIKNYILSFLRCWCWYRWCWYRWSCFSLSPLPHPLPRGCLFSPLLASPPTRPAQSVIG